MTEKIRKTKLGYELETCSRCGGTGHYSYCQMHGTKCFKCGGSGVVLNKKGVATKNYFIELTTKPVTDIKAGDLFRDNRWLTVKSISICENSSKLNDVWQDSINFELANDEGKTVMNWGMGLDSTQQSVKDSEEWKKLHNQALDYQTKLTKAGKLMKKYQ